MDTFINPTAGRRFLRLKDVKYKTGLGRSAIYHGVQHHKFPAPIKLGARAVAWNSDQIDAWMDARIEASRQQNGGL
jgi:prophage regulatory protein